MFFGGGFSQCRPGWPPKTQMAGRSLRTLDIHLKLRSSPPRDKARRPARMSALMQHLIRALCSANSPVPGTLRQNLRTEQNKAHLESRRGPPAHLWRCTQPCNPPRPHHSFQHHKTQPPCFFFLSTSHHPGPHPRHASHYAQRQYLIGSQTLTVCGAIVVGVTTVSSALSATEAVIRTTSMERLLAPYIVGGLGTAGPNGTGFFWGIHKGRSQASPCRTATGIHHLLEVEQYD